ncbi:MAG TPA: hypothetical protein VF173_07575 [Thermoanaerobaculia bacterium]|nr:hypothetical protein [Thermoanaerobaculia bacterium]
MSRIRHFAASVAYQNSIGQTQEDDFPVHAPDYATASRIAFTYVLNVLRYKDFELRIVGA